MNIFYLTQTTHTIHNNTFTILIVVFIIAALFALFLATLFFGWLQGKKKRKNAYWERRSTQINHF